MNYKEYLDSEPDDEPDETPFALSGLVQGGIYTITKEFIDATTTTINGISFYLPLTMGSEVTLMPGAGGWFADVVAGSNTYQVTITAALKLRLL